MTSVNLRLATFLAVFLAFPAPAAPLSEVDRQLILEKLEEIRLGAEGTQKSKIQVALSAFRAGAASNADAHEFYMNCIELVQYEDENRKSQEFREWKRKHKENGDTTALRLALRHQLNWLILYLQAATQPEDIPELAPRVASQLNAIFEYAEELQPQRGLLAGSVTGSVFAKAYGVDNLKAKDFPASPLDLAGIYDQVILPPLRNPAKIDSLRNAWTTRLVQEGKIKEEWGREASQSGELSPEFEKWLTDGRFDLTWEMNVDFFKAGDEKSAAMALLSQLQNNPGHKSFKKWVTEFAALMAPPENLEDRYAEENEEEKKESKDLAPE